MKFTQIISDGTKKGLAVGVLHLILIIAAYASPFWLDWRIVIIGVGLLWLQFIVFGGCILNQPQYGSEFGRNGNGLYERILTQLGIRYEPRRLKFYLDIVAPLVVLLVSLAWQLAGKFSPLVRL